MNKTIIKIDPGAHHSRIGSFQLTGYPRAAAARVCPVGEKLRRLGEVVRLARARLGTRVTLRRELGPAGTLAREAPGHALPWATTTAKQPGHFSTAPP
jgi:hypothetical protein